MNLKVVRTLEPDWLEGVICLDVEFLGGVQETVRYLQNTCIREGSIVIAALGPKGEDVSSLGGWVDGIMMKPSEDTREAWEHAARPLVHHIQDPDYRDELSPEECGGGVSQEAFAETLAQAALPDSDPWKRD